MAIPVWKHGICYYPVPKVANTSIKLGLYHLKTGEYFSPEISDDGAVRHIHKVYKTPYFAEVSHALHVNLIKFAVVRDPLDRLVSVWRNRVAFHRELTFNKVGQEKFKALELTPNPDLNTFVDRLDDYRQISGSIKAHSDKMTDYLGKDPTFFDLIFDIGSLDLLEKFLEIVSGQETHLPHEQTGGPKKSKSDLPENLLKKLKTFYEEDYDLFGEAFGNRTSGVSKRKPAALDAGKGE